MRKWIIFAFIVGMLCQSLICVGENTNIKNEEMNIDTIFEQMFFTTVKIETEYSNQKSNSGVGTGFIFMYIKEKNNYLFIITNRHVVKDSQKTTFYFHQGNEDNTKPLLGKAITVSINSKYWIYNDEYDIAIIPFVVLSEELHKIKKPIFFRTVASDIIWSKEKLSKNIDAVTEIFFVGYPNNVYDEENYLPIMRKGITSTPLYVDFNKKSKFLIDASVFPGSSGSPVFICNQGSYSPKKGGLAFGDRLIFVGVISEVYYKSDCNILKSMPIPSNQNIYFTQTNQMIDLGIVLKPNMIIELIEEFLKNIPTE